METEYQEFSGATKMSPKLRLTNAALVVMFVIVGVLLVALFASFAGPSSASNSSQGEAEVACEREIESQVGKNPTPAYTQITETGEGEFTLYGTVTSDYGSAKFTCQVTGAYGDGTATANADIYQ